MIEKKDPVYKTQIARKWVYMTKYGIWKAKLLLSDYENEIEKGLTSQEIFNKWREKEK